MRTSRLRESRPFRNMVRETRLNPEEFVYPIFVEDIGQKKQPINSMPGQFRIGLEALEQEIREIEEAGISSVLLFGIPDEKDPEAGSACDEDGIVQRAIRVIREISPEMTIITDVCLCEYKSDGHCCFFQDDHIDLEKTLDTLSRTALSHVRAGADMVAPSDMMDEHIAVIRKSLNENGYEHIPIMGYSAKFASAFYGPFREAADSAPQYGNRRAYQMDPANRREAIREVEADVLEGADIVMVKPAMNYLDIIRDTRERVNLPVAAYQVSGEYSMLKNAVDSGLLEERAIYESLVAIRRAGADIIISYFARELSRLIADYENE